MSAKLKAAKKKGKRMARPRGGGHTPQANAIITNALFDLACSAGALIANASYDYQSDEVPGIQVWSAKNPGTFRLVFADASNDLEDVSVEGSWDDGVTGQGYYRIVNEKGELLLQSQTFDLVGID